LPDAMEHAESRAGSGNQRPAPCKWGSAVGSGRAFTEHQVRPRKTAWARNLIGPSFNAVGPFRDPKTPGGPYPLLPFLPTSMIAAYPQWAPAVGRPAVGLTPKNQRPGRAPPAGEITPVTAQRAKPTPGDYCWPKPNRKISSTRPPRPRGPPKLPLRSYQGSNSTRHFMALKLKTVLAGGPPPGRRFDARAGGLSQKY